MLVLGLTGSIGMGKSATAGMFRAEGVPVFDSDAEVHRLYRGAAAPLIEQAFPGVTLAGTVDRTRLGRAILDDAAALARLEAIVHPLVREARSAFLETARKSGVGIVVFDIPLLFETAAETEVDATVVVSAAPEVQRERVLARPGMNEAKFAALLSRQMSDVEKRRRAHFVIDTGRGFAFAGRQVRDLLRAVAGAAAGRAAGAARGGEANA
jgi:dephospho-CoA kinase